MAKAQSGPKFSRALCRARLGGPDEFIDSMWALCWGHDGIQVRLADYLRRNSRMANFVTAEQFFRGWLVSHSCLTATENEVAKLLMRGYSLRDIGRKRRCAATTASVHACSIYSKVDV